MQIALKALSLLVRVTSIAIATWLLSHTLFVIFDLVVCESSIPGHAPPCMLLGTDVTGIAIALGSMFLMTGGVAILIFALSFYGSIVKGAWHVPNWLVIPIALSVTSLASPDFSAGVVLVGIISGVFLVLSRLASELVGAFFDRNTQ